MASDNAQQIFLCPTCGAQNVVGQQFCQACSQKLDYNCPYCGFIVDPTLMTCPGCRGALDWPTPQRVKAFPKERRTGEREDEESEGEDEGKPRKKKPDPWLTGCLGVVVIAFLVLGGYFVYDTFLQEAPSTIPYPVSDNQTGLKPMQIHEPELLQAVSGFMIPEDEVCSRA
ncbi:MAG: zinc ribbon domain-containing protein [Chloroflexi bacterium]|nr:zinc ribbon domain-containing protein [Chloroflexota bacterium]